MLIDTFDGTYSVQTLQLLFALGLGLVFGAAAQASRFCLRRAVAGEEGTNISALSVWVAALAAAIGAFSVASHFGYVDVSAHRLQSANLPIAAIVLGGLLFGAGMVLTRGCASRLTVLSATGNLRAVLVLTIFALVAHATLKGVLAPLRTSLGSVSVEFPSGVLTSSPLVASFISLILFAISGLLSRAAGTRPVHLFFGLLIGLVPVAGWVTTSILLMDEFEPLAVQSAAFTLPWSDTLFWFVASTSIPAGFGVGFIGGVLAGSFLSAAIRKELALQSFENPTQTLRYGAGGALMGLGGVLAGGCTVGAGLSGGAMLSISALIALGSIIVGAVVMRHMLIPRFRAEVTA